MATVGNLFVNVRGRTGGFVRDMKRAHKSVRKDFYVNESMAMQNLRKARERVGALNFASDERFAAGMKGLRVAEARMAIAAKRPGSRFGTGRRSELLAAKERGEAARAFLAREAKALIPLVLGVPAAALAFVVSQGVKAFQSAGKFAAIGPQGGRFISATVGKMTDEIAFAQRGDVSEVMARTAELERQNAFLWREVGLQFQIVMNYFAEQLGLDIMAPKIKGDPGFDPRAIDERARAALAARHRETLAAERIRARGHMTSADILLGTR
jgi:hypothetical protein